MNTHKNTQEKQNDEQTLLFFSKCDENTTDNSVRKPGKESINITLLIIHCPVNAGKRVNATEQKSFACLN